MSDESIELDEVVEDFTRQCRDGESPSVEDYAERYPQFAKEIRELFPTLLAMEQASPESDDEFAQTLDNGPSSSTLRMSRPERLGDYRIVREIGRGGMGVVYEAEQESLGRHVALKILPAQLMADSKQRRRFTREARAAARLHHTNIVPVFGVGEADGISYYAMQFIPGMPLNDVLEAVREQGTNIESAISDATRRRQDQDQPLEATASNLAHSMLSGQFYEPLTEDSAFSNIDHQEQTIAGEPTSSTRRQLNPRITSSKRERVSPENTSSKRQRVNPGNSSSVRERVNPNTTSSDSLAGVSSSYAGRSNRAYWESVARIGQQAADALGYAHGQGVIHRDIKPGNLLLDLAGTVWITDFGLAKAEEEDDLTKTGDVLGTLRYMPPEALQGRADASSDIFSLGLTLYELVARRPAYDEDDRHTLLKRITEAEVTRLSSLDHGIPRDLETIIHKSVAADSKDRYQNAAEMAADLERFLADEPIHARRMSPVERFTRWSRRNPGIATLGAVCTALLLAISGISTYAYFRTNSALDLAEQREVAAVTAQEQAEAARGDAETAQGEAEAARIQAVTAREKAEATTYRRNVELALLRYQEGHAGAASQLLDECPPERRGIEWRICRRMLEQYEWKFSPGGLDLSVSPDQSTLAVASNHRGVLLIDAQTGEEVRRLRLEGEIRRVDYHPKDDVFIVSNRNGDLWSVDTGGVIINRIKTGLDTRFGSGVFSPNGQLYACAGSGEHNLQVYSWPTLDLKWYAKVESEQSYSKSNASVVALAFSADGTQLVSSTPDERIQIWDAQVEITDEPHRPSQVVDTSGTASSLLLNRDGTKVTLGSWGGKIETLDVDDAITHLVGWHPKNNSIQSLARIDRQTIVSGSTDHSIRVWDQRKKTQAPSSAKVLVGHTEAVHSLAVLKDGSIVSCGNQQVFRWPLRSERESYADGVVSFHPSQPLLATAIDQQIQLRQVADDRPVGDPLAAMIGPIQALSFSPGGELLVASGPKGGAMWRWQTREQILQFDEPVMNVSAQEHAGPYFTGDASYLAMLNRDSELVVYDVSTGKRLSLPEALRRPSDECFGAANRQPLLAARYGDFIKVFHPVTGEVHSSFEHPNFITLAAFSPDDKMLLLSRNQRIITVDWESGELRNELQGHWRNPSTIAFSRDGTRAASGGWDGEVRVWEWPSGKPLLKLKSESRVSTVQFDNAGHWLRAGGIAGRHHRLWDARPGEERVEVLLAEAIDLANQSNFTAASERIEEASSLSKRPLSDQELATTLIEANHWSAALALTPATENNLRWVERACLQLLVGDEEGYRKRCREKLTRYGGSSVGNSTERLIRSCLLTPYVADRAIIDQVGEIVAQSTKEREITGPHMLSKGRVEFRLGRFDSAIEYLERCLSKVDELDERYIRWHRPMRVTARLLLAMSYDRIGDRERAKELLAESEAIALKYGLDSGFENVTIGDTLEYRITRAEAEHQLSRPSLALAPFDAETATAYQAEWADFLNVPIVKSWDLADGVTLATTLIPPGEFLMGSNESQQERLSSSTSGWWKTNIEAETPQHPVRISEPFWLGTTSVTVGQFRQFVEESGYQTDAARRKNGKGLLDGDFKVGEQFAWNTPGFPQNDEHPVVVISEEDAKAFCNWLSKRLNAGVSLPTEAQWEYACRAGTQTVYPFGDDPKDFPEFAWRPPAGKSGTTEAGLFAANAFGLHDMLGNSWDICADVFDSEFYRTSPMVDPINKAFTESTYRTIRGGGWRQGANFARSTIRIGAANIQGSSSVGFRVLIKLNHGADQVSKP